MQHLCTGDLRPHGAPKTAVLDLGQQLAFGDSGGVYDTAYRRLPVVVTAGEQSLHRVARSDVEGHGIDGDAPHLQRPDGGDLVAHVCVVGVAVPVAPGRQRSAPGEHQTTCAAVREPVGHQQTEGTHASGDQVCRIGATPQRFSHRFAGDGYQRGREEFAVAQRQDGLGRCPQHRGQRRARSHRCRRSARAGPPGRPTTRGCSARMTPASPHRQLWRTAASEAPSRTPRVMIHSVAGWLVVPLGQPADEIGHFRRQPDRAVDVGLSGVHRRGIGDIEDTPRLADAGRHVAAPRRADRAECGRHSSSPRTASVHGRIGGHVARRHVRPTVATRSRAPTCAGRHLRGAAGAGPDSAAAYRSPRMSMHVLPSGALHRDVDDQFVLVAAAPTYLDRTAVIGEFGFEPDAVDTGRKHQLRVGTVRPGGRRERRRRAVRPSMRRTARRRRATHPAPTRHEPIDHGTADLRCPTPVAARPPMTRRSRARHDGRCCSAASPRSCSS